MSNTFTIDLSAAAGAEASWLTKTILKYEAPVTAGDFATLKTRFTLGNFVSDAPPYTAVPISTYGGSGYSIGTTGAVE
ncbi:hypothetical protein AGMMS50230_18500 [Spirochaetia bacterium]|nr:hypothetical protein AGMMS50230_18500 [Spirochaetia bacterium]